MKKTLFILLIFGLMQLSQARQTDSTFVPAKFHFSASFGIAVMNPDDINNRIATTNATFGSTAKTVKSMPEISAALAIRPMRDAKIIVLRGGYLWAKRDFNFTMPQTDTSSTPTGEVNGTITETYTAYPFSIGVGLATLKSDAQLQVEFIYAIGYIKEDGAFITSDGKRTSYSSSLFSPAYGFRVAVQFAVPITEMLSLHLEVAYRGLTLDSYEDDQTGMTSPIEFRMTGISGTMGLTVEL
ncbi:MAG: hypothetical protein KGJ59_08795 [Bacteroidota bacterium]|nr:hypothetical protein [Bacteroidota bacterium]